MPNVIYGAIFSHPAGGGFYHTFRAGANWGQIDVMLGRLVHNWVMGNFENHCFSNGFVHFLNVGLHAIVSQLEPTWTSLGPTWQQFGINLASTWAQFGVVAG